MQSALNALSNTISDAASVGSATGAFISLQIISVDNRITSIAATSSRSVLLATLQLSTMSAVFTLQASASAIYEVQNYLLLSSPAAQKLVYKISTGITSLRPSGGKVQTNLSVAGNSNAMISTVGAGGWFQQAMMQAGTTIIDLTIGTSAGTKVLIADGIIVDGTSGGTITFETGVSTGQVMQVLPGS